MRLKFGAITDIRLNCIKLKPQDLKIYFKDTLKCESLGFSGKETKPTFQLSDKGIQKEICDKEKRTGSQGAEKWGKGQFNLYFKRVWE